MGGEDVCHCGGGGCEPVRTGQEIGMECSCRGAEGRADGRGDEGTVLDPPKKSEEYAEAPLTVQGYCWKRVSPYDLHVAVGTALGQDLKKVEQRSSSNDNSRAAVAPLSSTQPEEDGGLGGIMLQSIVPNTT